jgi:D-sedoheptulose 7-phosphate isomerase
MQTRLRETLAAHLEVIRSLESLLPEVERLAGQATECLRAGGRILWMGNGGSAADCQHLAAELVGRFERDRRGLASIALTTDTSILTSVGNDYGFERIFARQVEALCRPEDLLIGLSTSGNSRNVLAALEVAARLGTFRAGLTGGTGGKLRAATDLCLVVPSANTARIQEAHILIGHMLCDLVETALEAETHRGAGRGRDAAPTSDPTGIARS